MSELGHEQANRPRQCKVRFSSLNRLQSEQRNCSRERLTEDWIGQLNFSFHYPRGRFIASTVAGTSWPIALAVLRFRGHAHCVRSRSPLPRNQSALAR
jgi:hypothetical protein